MPLSAVSLLCVFLFIFYRHRLPFTAPNLPPGRMGFPIVGESLEFLMTGWKGRPEKFFFDRTMKYSSEVFKTSLLCKPMVVLGGAAGNKFLFSNEYKLVTLWMPDNMHKVFPSSFHHTSCNGEAAKKVRMLLPQFLKPEALRRYVGTMDRIAQAHLDSLLAKHETLQVAAYPLVKRYTLLLAYRLFVSIEDEKHIASIEKHYNALGSGLITLPIDLPGTPFHKSIKASKFIRKQLVDIIRQRKVDLSQGNNAASPTQDILSNMLLICDMDEWQIADQLLGILFGCYDTISTTCTLIIKYLSQFPHMYHRVYQGKGV
ncbi:hypothetical protein PIB30_013901 [Stylosanthes scabra]|uniref:Uncharacterized protein n=1 Tax=Stylosanthes scabra TaxID=79078 RepID=A0ABU6W9M7_9FABA|nr:hypothetical protein [Stylosanthes scabra]